MSFSKTLFPKFWEDFYIKSKINKISHFAVYRTKKRCIHHFPLLLFWWCISLPRGMPVVYKLKVCKVWYTVATGLECIIATTWTILWRLVWQHNSWHRPFETYCTFLIVTEDISIVFSCHFLHLYTVQTDFLIESNSAYWKCAVNEYSALHSYFCWSLHNKKKSFLCLFLVTRQLPNHCP